MSIILNGASYRSVWWWTRHFNDTKENVRTEIVKSEGLASEDIRDKMLEMQLMAEGTRCKNFMWIADLSPHPGVSRRFSEEEWERARQIAEKFRGLEGQPYFVIEQEKADGRIHRHAIWSRVDPETGRARPDGWDSEVCHAASKAIRQELGLQPLPSPFDKDRQGPRPKRAPQRWEMYRGMKSGLDPRVITAEVTELFHQSDNGRAFHAALELHGYTLVKGDRRGFVILDSAGDDHSLARRIDGVNTKELNAFMRGVDREALPTVEQGRAQHQLRTIAALEADRATVRDEIRWEEALDRAAIEKEERERNFVEPVGQQEKKRDVGVQKEAQAKTEAPELGRTAGEIRLAYSLTQTGQEFANALEDRGYILARITGEDAERLNRWDRQRRKEEWEAPAPVAEKEKEQKPEYERFKPGDLAVVTPNAQIYPLTKANTGDGRKDREEHLKDIDRAMLLSVTDAENVMRGVQRHRKEEREQERLQRREEILREAAEKHWPAKPPQPEQKSPGLFAQAADQASRDERVANLKGPAAQIWKLWTRIDPEKHAAKIGEGVSFSVGTDTKAFAAALDEKGIGFAVATKDEAERSHKQAALAKAAGHYAPRFKEGEIVIVSAPRPEFRRDGEIIVPPRVQKLDQSLAEKFTKALGTRFELKGIEATKQTLVERVGERAAEWDVLRLKNATKTKGRRGGRTDRPPAPDLAKAGSAVIGGAIGALGKLADGFSLDALSPKEKYEAAKRDHRNEQEADKNADFDAYMAGLAEARQKEQEREATQHRERQKERERER
jgi:hypothetical protein